MATGVSSPGRPRPRRGRFRFFLFVFIVIFGLGFYSGMRVTRHVARSSPLLVQRFFGVEGNWLGLPTPPPAPPPVPAPTVTQIAPASVAPAAPTVAAPSAVQSSPTHPTNLLPESNPVPPAGMATAGTEAAFAQQVTDYNAALLNAANTFRDYTVALQSANDMQAKAEVRDAARDHVNTAADELLADVHHAQALYDMIHANPLFPTKYKETDKALNTALVRQQFAELSVDNLRYIRPR